MITGRVSDDSSIKKGKKRCNDAIHLYLYSTTQCLKFTEKVSFNIASEASYVYILSGQKLIKNAKNVSILASFWKPEACGQTVLPDRSISKGQKLVENAKIQKFKCDILGDFQTLWSFRVTFILKNLCHFWCENSSFHFFFRLMIWLWSISYQPLTSSLKVEVWIVQKAIPKWCLTTFGHLWDWPWVSRDNVSFIRQLKNVIWRN